MNCTGIPHFSLSDHGLSPFLIACKSSPPSARSNSYYIIERYRAVVMRSVTIYYREAEKQGWTKTFFEFLCFGGLRQHGMLYRTYQSRHAIADELG